MNAGPRGWGCLRKNLSCTGTVEGQRRKRTLQRTKSHREFEGQKIPCRCKTIGKHQKKIVRQSGRRNGAAPVEPSVTPLRIAQRVLAAMRSNEDLKSTEVI